VADAHTDDYHHGEMNVSAQTHDFHVFLGFTKWACLYLGALVLLLTTWFCTSAGFFPALISAAVVIAIGVPVLSDKPSPAH
jgi:hypothetical protein